MEKDSADNATTEFENSVTSEERGSSVDKKEVKMDEKTSDAALEADVDRQQAEFENSNKSADSEEKKVDEQQSIEDKPEELIASGSEETPAAQETKIEEAESTPTEPEVEQNSQVVVVEEEIAPATEEPIAPVEEEQVDPVEVLTESTNEEAKAPVAEAPTPVVEEPVAPIVEEAALPPKEEKDEPVAEEAGTPKEEEKADPVDGTTSPDQEETTGPDAAVDQVPDDEVAQQSDDQTAKADDKKDEATEDELQSLNEQSNQLAESVEVEPDIYEEFEGEDFATYSKEQLVEVVKKLGKDDDPIRADRVLQKIAPIFNQLRADEKKTALDTFIKEGGTVDDFDYKPDELALRFDANYKLIKDKKSRKAKERESVRTQNLVLAEDILSELREFMDSEESSASFNQFKDIQQKWKDLGDVPAQNSKTLWANYNALIQRFYDQRSIYFELKELDRKKNYEAKLRICDKAEALVNVGNLREAIKTLNDLHHDFKHLGPVPKELQEDLWQRFKAASDKVYERRKTFVHELKAELQDNLEKKEALVERISAIIDFQSDRIKEWNEKTKEVVAIQKEWESIGGLPKDKAKEINKKFWSSFKKFFGNKHKFFKKLDADRDTNLEKKQVLLNRALELKESEDWDATANELKKLQNQWREIGPVPEKMRKKIYEAFKAACDQFFDNRRKGLKNSQEQYKENLKKKKELINKIEGLVKDADKNLDKFNELREQFDLLGYVPKKNIGSIKQEYQEAVEKYLNSVTTLNVKEKTEISLAAEFSGLAASDHSETELYHKEQSVRRQISKYEDDIALWQNNLEFFAHSKSTDKLREDVNKKIEAASLQVDSLKRQLKMLRSL